MLLTSRVDLAAALSRKCSWVRIFRALSSSCPSPPTRCSQRLPLLLVNSYSLGTKKFSVINVNVELSIPPGVNLHRGHGIPCSLDPAIPAKLLKAGHGERWPGILSELRNHNRNLLYRAASTATSGGRRNWGQEKNVNWRFSTIFLFLPCVATFGLGVWQLFRRQWKIEVLDYRRKRLEEEPIPLTSALGEAHEGSEGGEQSVSPSGRVAQDELEFRTVICEGHYDTGRNIYVGPRARTIFGATQKGYFVITPLLPSDNSSEVSVLVNRGWAPSGWAEELSSAQPRSDAGKVLETEESAVRGPWWKFWSNLHQSSGDGEGEGDIHLRGEAKAEAVYGVIRGSEQPNAFVPLNAPGAGQWFYVDVPAMAQYLGLPKGTIYLEAVKKPEKSDGKEVFPSAKDLDSLLHSSVMPQDHINYALTWFTLSAATTYMAFKRVYGSKGRP